MQLSVGIRNERTKKKKKKEERKQGRGFAQTDSDDVLWIEYEFKKRSFSCWSFLCCSIISLVQRQVCLGKHAVLEVTWLSRDSSEQFMVASWGENKGTVVQLLSPEWLSANTWSVALQAPLSMEFSRQEQLEWFAIAFWESSQPRDWTQVSCIAGNSLLSEPPRRSLLDGQLINNKNLLLTVLEAEKSMIEVPTDLLPGECLLPVL